MPITRSKASTQYCLSESDSERDSITDDEDSGADIEDTTDAVSLSAFCFKIN
jgi:hypothetical protein